MSWWSSMLRRIGFQDRRKPFSPPVPDGRRQTDRIEAVRKWQDEIEMRVAEVEARIRAKTRLD